MKKISIILFLIAVILITSGIFFAGKDKNKEVAETQLTPPQGSPLLLDPPLQEELAPPDNTIGVSDWKTYRNEEFGFEVEYPKGWFVNVRSNRISFGNGWSRPGGGLWQITINMSENTLENEVENFISKIEKKSRKVEKESIKNIQINGYPGISFILQTNIPLPYRSSKRIFFVRGDKISSIFEDEGAVSEYNPDKDNGEKFERFYKSFMFFK